MMRILKTTILGGILFLFPIVIFITIIQEALKLTNDLAIPLANMLSVETIGGFAIAKLLTIFFLLLFCFIAGLLAKTRLAKRFIDWLENSILSKFPAYALIKAKTHSVLTPEDVNNFKPTLLKTGEGWKMAYITQQLNKQQCIVFVPFAPNAWTGSLSIVPSNQTTPLDMSVRAVADLLSGLGHDHYEALNNALETADKQ